MTYDISEELRDYTYITNVYKCISNYNLKGHQIGRKVGDMLEILTMGAIYSDQNLRDRLAVESKLEGFTGAGHKVEFGFFESNTQDLFGAIECKCVGVEETTDGKGSKAIRNISVKSSFQIEFSNRWLDETKIVKIQLNNIINSETVEVLISHLDYCDTFELKIGQDFKICLDEEKHINVLKPYSNMLTEIPSIVRECENIYLKAISSQTVSFELKCCLTGPQTIEKAKQASLVAMDLRKKIDGYWGKEEISLAQRKFTFVHVLCEFSHWEAKSLNVIKTCIDHNVIVPDVVIIKAFEIFENCFTLAHMLDFISKNKFESDDRVKDAIRTVIDFFDEKIFYDLEQKCYIKFSYDSGKLVLIEQ